MAMFAVTYFQLSWCRRTDFEDLRLVLTSTSAPIDALPSGCRRAASTWPLDRSVVRTGDPRHVPR